MRQHQTSTLSSATVATMVFITVAAYVGLIAFAILWS
jgi:hypothetical protein